MRLRSPERDSKQKDIIKLTGSFFEEQTCLKIQNSCINPEEVVKFENIKLLNSTRKILEKKMTKEEIIKLYEKEREYQREIFSDYKNNPSLNLGSFLLFLDNYLNKAKKYYVSKWTNELPEWLLSSKEFIQQGSCPAESYKELIKIFALAGAALESYSAIDVSKWRNEGVKDKWKVNINER